MPHPGLKPLKPGFLFSQSSIINSSNNGRHTVAVSGGAVSQWSDRWNGTPCEVLGGRTYAVWDAWGTVSSMLMSTGWWSLRDLSIWSKSLLTPAMNFWIEASVEAILFDISTELSKIWCESALINQPLTLFQECGSRINQLLNWILIMQMKWMKDIR